MKKIFFSLTMIILLVSCSNKNPYTVRHTAVTDTFLTERVCNLPCWQNITPGVTSFAEGMNIMKTSNLAENFELIEAKDSDNYHSTFMWDFIKLDPSTTVNDEGFFNKEAYEDSISYMNISFYYSFMSLQDFVLLYGEPDRVAFSLDFNTHPPYTKVYYIDLIYDEINIMVSVRTVEKRSKLMIDENAIVLEISIPEKDRFKKYVYHKTIDWEGYGDYASILDN